MTQVHPTAIVDGRAEIEESATIGAYSIVGPHVRVGPGSVISHHVVLDGHTSIGAGNLIAPFCSIGGPPQDKKYCGEPTRLEIGDRNVIREYCFFNVGTVQDRGVTSIGHDNWIMAYVHVGHDCQIGNNTQFANSVQLAGHVQVGDWAVLGGLTGIHQFVKVGAHAMTAVHTTLLQDLPPFVLCSGQPAEPRTINTEGLRRRGFQAEVINALRRAYKTLYRDGLSLDDAKAAILAQANGDAGAAPHLRALVEFIASSTRGIVR